MKVEERRFSAASGAHMEMGFSPCGNRAATDG